MDKGENGKKIAEKEKKVWKKQMEGREKRKQDQNRDNAILPNPTPRGWVSYNTISLNVAFMSTRVEQQYLCHCSNPPHQ